MLYYIRYVSIVYYIRYVNNITILMFIYFFTNIFSCFRSTLINKTEKIALLSKLSQPINYFEDAKVTSIIFNTRNVENYDSKKFQTERAQSAPGIVETSAISQQNR